MSMMVNRTFRITTIGSYDKSGNAIYETEDIYGGKFYVEDGALQILDTDHVLTHAFAGGQWVRADRVEQ